MQCDNSDRPKGETARKYIVDNMCENSTEEDQENEEAFLNVKRVRTLLNVMFKAYNKTYGTDIIASSQPMSPSLPHMSWILGSSFGDGLSSSQQEMSYRSIKRLFIFYFFAFILNSLDATKFL